MNSKIYFNASWAISRQGFKIPLWASYSPPMIASDTNSSSHTNATSESFSAATNLIEGPAFSPILFIGGVHGDEPEGVWLAESLLNSLITFHRRKTHQSKVKSNGHPAWVIIPCLNPEGLSKNERTNSSGVDLNRNFPSPDWSSESKAPRYFPGEQPATEPEVKAAIQAIEIFQPQLIIHFHSWKPCIVYTGEPAKSMAQVLSEHSGYPFHEDIGYPTPGSLGQYGWLSKQIPVICIEEQEGAAREHVWSRFQWALMDLLK